MPVETYVDEGYCTVVPDLVAEVISPTDFFTDVAVKRDQWLSAGVRIVWVVEPETRTIYVHRPDGVAFLRSTDTLTAEGVLPGFAVPIADLFRKPGEGVGK
jgi:Uma2 family endonuclease